MLSLCRFLTIKSTRHFILLRLSYLITTYTPFSVQWGKPVTISIEPVNYCNLKCPECPTGNGEMTRQPDKLSFGFSKQIIDQVKSHVRYMTVYFQGEPFINEETVDIIAYANSQNIYTATSTNGHFINENNAEAIVRSGLQKLIVSLDGFDQKSYIAYRKNGSYEKVINAIRLIADAKTKLGSPTPIISAQTLLLSSTENKLKEIEHIAYDAGADMVEFKTAQFYDLELRSKLLPKNAQKRYKQNANGEFSHKGEMKNKCWRAWSTPVICSNGEVAPCCYDKNAMFSYGNIGTDNFLNLWQSNSKLDFINIIHTDKSRFDMCKNCPEGRV